jgi:GT2 family glycosyltransferase
VALIRNETNLGFVKATNQGLRASDADYVCLLNNDTKVDEKWLEELIKVAKNDSKIGIVNPGGFSGSSKKKELSGKWIKVGFTTGFCMLIKREVINRVGFLDEDYGIGFWEDTDYCMRAKKAGYICASAKAAYVYHYSHKSFNFFKKDNVNELFEKNKNIFYSKWGKILRIACVVFEKEINDKFTKEILKLANEGHMIYLFQKWRSKIKMDFKQIYIRRFRYPDILFSYFVFIKILHRRKKKFTNVLTDNSKFASKLAFITPQLKITVVRG